MYKYECGYCGDPLCPEICPESKQGKTTGHKDTEGRNGGEGVMEIVNFICPFSSQEQKEAWSLLTNCAVCGFPYEQAKDYMEGMGIYLPEDQYKLLCELLDTQIDLGTGSRQGENHIV